MTGLDPPIVVVADRDLDFALAVERELSAGAYSVKAAVDAGELVALLARYDVDLILLDEQFPSAWRIVREAKHCSPPCPPLVMLSGAPSIEDAVRAIKFGAAEYRAKSIAGRALRDVCEAVIDDARAGAPVRGDVDSDQRHSLALNSDDSPESHRLRMSIRGLIEAAQNDRIASFSDGHALQGEIFPRKARSPGRLCIMEQIEKQAMIEAIGQAHGNVVAAAKLLGVGQATVYRKIKRYNIALREKRRRRRETVPAE